MSTGHAPRSTGDCVAILAAAGQGTRLGGDRPKQYRELAGVSLLERSVRAFLEHPRIAEVIVALPASDLVDPPAFLAALGSRVRLVAGGARRQDSVAHAFAAAPHDIDVIVIHDAARPLVDAATIDRTIDAARTWGAAIAALPVRDTVKLVVQGSPEAAAPPVIAATIDRDRVWLAQTPQAFTRAVLGAAIARGAAGAAGTDEAALAEQAGHRVRLVEGDARNIKITTPADLAVAERLLAAGTAGMTAGGFRVGTGYDSHRFTEGRPLVLGGVTIPHTAGLDGHSDADALCHAFTDAVLGAAALGDIGRHFPDADPRWKDADSVELLRAAVQLVRGAGFRIVNVDAVVVAERPKLAPYVDGMRARLAPVLEVSETAIGIKGKTNEGMGETGRGEGIVVHAVALLASW